MKTRNIAGGAAEGAITGMYGSDIGGDAFLIQGQKNILLFKNGLIGNNRL